MTVCRLLNHLNPQSGRGTLLTQPASDCRDFFPAELRYHFQQRHACQNGLFIFHLSVGWTEPNVAEKVGSVRRAIEPSVFHVGL
jgi:hypothetical protein